MTRRVLEARPSPTSMGGSFPALHLMPQLLETALEQLGSLLWALTAWELLLALFPSRWAPAAGVRALGSAILGVGFLINAELLVRQQVWPTRGDGYLTIHAARYWTFNKYDSSYGLSVNSYGLRGVEISPEKEPDEFRVLCLGDSITAGFNLPERHTYPFQLQAYLRRRFPGRLIRVQNGGVNGYSILQGALVLDEIRRHYKPDLVIVEHTHSNLEAVDRHNRAWLSHRPPLVELRKLLFESMLYLTLRHTLYPSLRDPLIARLGRGPRSTPPGPAGQEYADRELSFYRTYARWFVEQSRQHSFRLAFYIPYLHDIGGHMRPLEGGGPTPAAARILREVAEENQLTVADLDRTWRMIPGIQGLLQDDSHPTVEGTLLQAHTIGRALIRDGLFPWPATPEVGGELSPQAEARVPGAPPGPSSAPGPEPGWR